MKIFTSPQIGKCDAFTVENEPVTSLKLMERAATACAEWLCTRFSGPMEYHIFCGPGNNGGDGFAIARLLYHKGFDVNIYLDTNAILSTDALINFERVKDIYGVEIIDFNRTEEFEFGENSVLVDALFGTGLSRNPEGQYADLIMKLNRFRLPKISIDIPSGLFADQLSDDNAVVFKADETLSFQFWKTSFLHQETGKYCGRIHILDIGLSKDFIADEPTGFYVVDEDLIQNIYKRRDDFSHKGNYGKATIVAGSFGKMGAAVLGAKAALRSGCGITYVLAPKCGYEILQASCPEAMYIAGGGDFISNFNVDDDSVVGIGPGLGKDPETENAFLQFLSMYNKPLVLDADALNILAAKPENLRLIPQNSIITPHPKEFERLFGKTENSFERLKLAKEKAKELGIYIVLKGHRTQIITPDDKVFYNITGNSGMAKGGSGDVLLGIITSLLAQNYSVEEAALFGIWLHGRAGDFAAKKHSKEAMLSTDLICEIGETFRYLNKKPFKIN